MSKLGILAGLAAAGAAYLGLDYAGVIEPIFDYFRMTPNSALGLENFLHGTATLSAVGGGISAMGCAVGKAANGLPGKSPSYLEGLVDSGLTAAMFENEQTREFFRDNLLYKLDLYSNKLEGFLESGAKVATVAFFVALVYTMAAKGIEKLE